MSSRLFIFFLSFIILTMFQNYISIPFYWLWIGSSYIDSWLSFISINVVPVSNLVQYSYMSLPFLFLFKVIYKKLVVHDN